MLSPTTNWDALANMTLNRWHRATLNTGPSEPCLPTDYEGCAPRTKGACWISTFFGDANSKLTIVQNQTLLPPSSTSNFLTTSIDIDDIDYLWLP
jgi:hypothetical protein